MFDLCLTKIVGLKVVQGRRGEIILLCNIPVHIFRLPFDDCQAVDFSFTDFVLITFKKWPINFLRIKTTINVMRKHAWIEFDPNPREDIFKCR